MKTLLVLAQHPQLPEAIRVSINPEHYRVVHRLDLQEAEPLLSHGLLDACIVDVDMTNVQGIWLLEKLRRRIPNCPLVLYTSAKTWEWEEEAYLLGVSHILSKPPRARLLNAILERIWPKPARPPLPQPPRVSETPRLLDAGTRGTQALEVLRDFSAILTHSLDAEGMLKQFLLLLREIIGVNRAAIFLRHRFPMFGENPPVEETRCLRSACAIGLSPGLLEHFELSFEAGIGGYLFRQGRILRRESDVAQDLDIQKEFELLGAQVAIPILDRETLIGVATFDGRITGESLVSSELGLIFHLLEQLGLAIKNIWLHDQLSANHEMMVDILRQLSSACVVISRDLAILNANKTARKYFLPHGNRSGDLEFSDLPQVLGSKVYQVLKTGTGISAFKYHPQDSPETVYHVTIVPFQTENSALPNAALLMVEDHTQSEHLQKLEIEAANLRLVKTMADRLAHEVGNALVPISTHQQLLSTKYRDPEFRASLEVAMADGVKRVSRLINQMRYLARDTVSSRETFPLAPLIEEAYQEARKHNPVKSAALECDVGQQPIILAGDRAALKHAFSEVMLNALQANPADARIKVRLRSEANGHAGAESALQIEVQDNGGGFTADSAKKVAEPFFTTRNVGLGLGMTVSRKIIETHHGNLTVVNPAESRSGVVRITLPVENAAPGGEKN